MEQFYLVWTPLASSVALVASQGRGPVIDTPATPAGPVSERRSSRGRGLSCRGASAFLRDGAVRRGSRVNKNFVNRLLGHVYARRYETVLH